jgi:hypothetical protein
MSLSAVSSRVVSKRITPVADAAFLLLVLVSCLISLQSQNFLPANYFYDGNSIQAIAQGMPFADPDPSYAATGAVYKFFGLGALPEITKVLSIIISGFIFWTVNKEKLRQLKLTAWVLSSCGMLLATVYLSWYSKDLIALCFLFAAFSLTKFRIPFEIAPIILYGLVFRQYWLLIVGVYLIFFFMARVRRFASSSILFWLGLAILSFTIIALGYSLIVGRDLSSIRESINVFRIGSIDAKTLIQPFLAGTSLGESVVNAFLVFLGLLAPLPLLLLGSPQYVIASSFVGFLWISFFAKAKRASAGLGAQDRILRISILAWSMAIVLAVFEPDYGSYLRHLTALLPLLIFVICSETESTSKNQGIRST